MRWAFRKNLYCFHQAQKRYDSTMTTEEVGEKANNESKKQHSITKNYNPNRRTLNRRGISFRS